MTSDLWARFHVFYKHLTYKHTYGEKEHASPNSPPRNISVEFTTEYCTYVYVGDTHCYGVQGRIRSACMQTDMLLLQPAMDGWPLTTTTQGENKPDVYEY